MPISPTASDVAVTASIASRRSLTTPGASPSPGVGVIKN
jgi:hypothetical protein